MAGTVDIGSIYPGMGPATFQRLEENSRNPIADEISGELGASGLQTYMRGVKPNHVLLGCLVACVAISYAQQRGIL